MPPESGLFAPIARAVSPNLGIHPHDHVVPQQVIPVPQLAVASTRRFHGNAWCAFFGMTAGVFSLIGFLTFPREDDSDLRKTLSNIAFIGAGAFFVGSFISCVKGCKARHDETQAPLLQTHLV